MKIRYSQFWQMAYFLNTVNKFLKSNPVPTLNFLEFGLVVYYWLLPRCMGDG